MVTPVNDLCLKIEILIVLYRWSRSEFFDNSNKARFLPTFCRVLKIYQSQLHTWYRLHLFLWLFIHYWLVYSYMYTRQKMYIFNLFICFGKTYILDNRDLVTQPLDIHYIGFIFLWLLMEHLKWFRPSVLPNVNDPMWK